MVRKHRFQRIVFGVVLDLALLGRSVAAQTIYRGVLKTADSSQAVTHARVDAMYAPFTLFQLTKPRFPLASTYSDEHGAFFLSLPAYIREKPTLLTALEFEAQRKIRLEGRLNRPRANVVNTIVVVAYSWESPERLMNAVGIKHRVGR